MAAAALVAQLFPDRSGPALSPLLYNRRAPHSRHLTQADPAGNALRTGRRALAGDLARKRPPGPDAREYLSLVSGASLPAPKRVVGRSGVRAGGGGDRSAPPSPSSSTKRISGRVVPRPPDRLVPLPRTPPPAPAGGASPPVRNTATSPASSGGNASPMNREPVLTPQEERVVREALSGLDTQNSSPSQLWRTVQNVEEVRRLEGRRQQRLQAAEQRQQQDRRAAFQRGRTVGSPPAYNRGGTFVAPQTIESPPPEQNLPFDYISLSPPPEGEQLPAYDRPPEYMDTSPPAFGPGDGLDHLRNPRVMPVRIPAMPSLPMLQMLPIDHAAPAAEPVVGAPTNPSAAASSSSVDWMDVLGEVVGGVGALAAAAETGGLSAAAEGLLGTEVGGALSEEIGQLLGPIGEVIGDVGTAIGDVVGDVAQEVGEVLGPVAELMAPILGPAFDAGTAAFEETAAAGGGFGRSLENALSAGLDSAADSAFGAAKNVVGAGIDQFAEEGTGIVQGLANQGLDKLSSSLKESSLGKNFPKTIDALRNVGGKAIEDGIKTQGQAIADSVKGKVNETLDDWNQVRKDQVKAAKIVQEINSLQAEVKQFVGKPLIAQTQDALREGWNENLRYQELLAQARQRRENVKPLMNAHAKLSYIRGQARAFGLPLETSYEEMLGALLAGPLVVPTLTTKPAGRVTPQGRINVPLVDLRYD